MKDPTPSLEEAFPVDRERTHLYTGAGRALAALGEAGVLVRVGSLRAPEFAGKTGGGALTKAQAQVVTQHRPALAAFLDREPGVREYTERLTLLGYSVFLHNAAGLMVDREGRNPRYGIGFYVYDNRTAPWAQRLTVPKRPFDFVHFAIPTAELFDSSKGRDGAGRPYTQ